MTKLVSVEIRGNRSTWGVNWHASQEQIDAMRQDGIEVYELENIVPAWVVDAGLMRPFVFLQDLWNLKNPFKQ